MPDLVMVPRCTLRMLLEQVMSSGGGFSVVVTDADLNEAISSMTAATTLCPVCEVHNVDQVA